MKNIKYHIRIIGELFSFIIWAIIIIPIGILVAVINDILKIKDMIIRTIKRHK